MTSNDTRPVKRSALTWLHHNLHDLLGIPLALLLFWASGIALRWLEPTSAIYDAGVLQGVTIVIVHLLIGNSVARVGASFNIGWFHRNTSANVINRQWLFIIYLAAYCLLASLL